MLVLQKEKPQKPLLRKLGENIANKFKNIRQFAGELKNKIFSSRTESEGEPAVREE